MFAKSVAAKIVIIFVTHTHYAYKFNIKSILTLTESIFC